MAQESKLQSGANAIIVVALTIVGAILLNIIGNSGYTRVDLTEGNLNSLSDATVDVLDTFDEVEVTVYISADMPDKIKDPKAAPGPDGEVAKLDLRIIKQKFRDVLEEYKSRSNGKLTLTYAVGDNLVDQAKKAKLSTFAGEQAQAKGDVVEFTEYVIGATFHYGAVMERLPLALEPAYYEFEITKRLQRLKEKADATVPMKFVLRNGEALNSAVKTCMKTLEAAVPKDKPGAKKDPLAMLSGESARVKLEALKKALPDMQRDCAGVAKALETATGTKLDQPSKPFENLTAMADFFQKNYTKLVEAMASEDPQTQAEVPQFAGQVVMIGENVDARHDILVDSPGKKAIGFVCVGATFCPFADNKPLIPPQLKSAMAGKNQFNARIITDLEGLAQNINRQLEGIRQQLFETKGFRLVRVDLDERVPSYVEGLVILGAREKFTDEQLYVLDQFVLGGGSLVTFINSWDVSIQNWSGNDRMDVTKLMPNESNIGDLLGHYGIRPNGDLVMEPKNHDQITLQATVRQGQLAFQAPKGFDYPMLPMVQEFDSDSPLVRSVSTLTLPFASSLVLSDSEGVKALVLSSPEAITNTDMKFPLLPTEQLLRVEGQVNPQPKKLVLAAVSQGEFTSYFDGTTRKVPVLKPKSAGDGEDKDAAAKPIADDPGNKHRAAGAGRILVIGSNMGLEALSVSTVFKGFSPAMLADNALQHIDKIRGYGASFRNWTARLGQIQHLIVDQAKKRWGESLLFIFNALDWSIQNDAMVALRSKTMDRRPLGKLSDDDKANYRILGIGLGPLLVLLFGGILWFRRRRSRQRVAFLAGASKPFGV